MNFNSIISTNSHFDITNLAYKQAKLPFHLAGFDLGETTDIRHAACIASTLECIEELSHIIPNFNIQSLKTAIDNNNEN